MVRETGTGDSGSGKEGGVLLPSHMIGLGGPSSDSWLPGLAALMNIGEGAWRAHGEGGGGERALLSVSGLGARR